ncbi:hypothetical protein JOF48_003219 [Arthrobacter stackebrandtii]|uniref:DUF5129 domain-containing protein n=1 Tax=Arthrobacter stackebrandtii TaxID=272161 RepID=A0ABS4Z0R6_9MICC|nr:hypothetical protein [Arthrobacter stackebrandtii]MBP2414420.1 hypothetical protein [Arthrobacter stackebrandtii]PYH01551.1 hypothetical protein CVV67_03495 [Arthrobacter stackebrandtii]
MTTQLIGVRKRPHFGLPWLAFILSVATAGFGIAGVQAMTANKPAQLEIIVEGSNHPYGINAQTVAAALPGPVATWRPMRLLVTDRLLSHDELSGRSNPGADAILSTALTPLDTSQLAAAERPPERRFTGAGIYGHSSGEARYDRFDLADAYRDNLALGHGPGAVAAAAQRTADLVDRGPIQDLAFWLTGFVAGLVLSIVALAWSLSRRRRREQLFHSLAAAQSQLAGVVLELEALEASYHSAVDQDENSALAATWAVIRDDSLALARTEDATVAAAYDSRLALRQDTRTMVADFATKAARLAREAEALMAASSVRGGFAGGRSVLERLAAPIALGGKELLATLEQRPGSVIREKRVAALRTALETLLGVPGRGGQSAATIAAWRAGETELLRQVSSINRTLRHHLKHPLARSKRQYDDHSEIRRGLGLPPALSRDLLAALDMANLALPEVFDKVRGISNRASAGSVVAGVAAFVGGLAIRDKTVWIIGSAATVVVAMIVSGSVLAGLGDSPQWELKGKQGPASLLFDGDTTGLDTDYIRRNVATAFSRPMHITVAIRDADEYLSALGESPDYGAVGENDPQVLFDALWRIKQEFPALLEPESLEMSAEQAIIPVFRTADDRFSAPTVITGALALGKVSWLNDGRWKHGIYGFSDYGDYGDYKIVDALEDLARGLQNNGLQEPRIGSGLKFWLLTLAVSLSALLLVLVIYYGSLMSTQLGRFGRSSANLRAANRTLEKLMLGLDESRLNAVMLLGAGPAANSAETGQRIFEGALAMAWRLRDSLSATPLAQRLSADYAAQVSKLADLATALATSDNDVQRQSRRLLDASFGRPPNAPHRKR